jgi:hypothetical protein
MSEGIFPLIMSKCFLNFSWYDYFTGTPIVKKNDYDRYANIENYLDDFIPLYQKGGTIITT